MILDLHARTLSYVIGQEDFGVAFTLPPCPDAGWMPFVRISSSRDQLQVSSLVRRPAMLVRCCILFVCFLLLLLLLLLLLC